MRFRRAIAGMSAVRLLMGAASIAVPAIAAAQVSDPRPASAAARWEIHLHGGISHARLPADGTGALPPPGPPLPTSNPTFATRRIPSWFFGDGAALLNDVNAQFGIPARLAPLDAALESLNLGYNTRTTIGVRVRRAVTTRYSAELAIDVLGGSAEIDDELLSAVAATRDSFSAAMAALLAEGPFTAPVVDARSSAIHGANREIAITGAATMRFPTGGGFVPYATFGAGVLSGSGDLPSVTLTGTYRLRILDEVPIEETDRLTLRYTHRAGFVGVLGGGVSRVVGSGWGLQVDGRLFVGPSRVRLLIDADPVVVRGTPADSIETTTSPSIQFSNDPAIGRSSTLSGSLDAFAAFRSSGVQTRVLITFGVFFTF
jgi:hypothetical protein